MRATRVDHEGARGADADPAAAPLRAPEAGVDAVLHLQRTAGNRAVARLVARASLQRQLDARPADFDPLISGSSRSSFAAVRSAVASYHKAKASAQPEALDRLERRAVRWLNAHRGNSVGNERVRRQFLHSLLDDVAAARVADSREWAEEIYYGNIKEAAKGRHAKQGPYGLELLSPGAHSSATQPLSQAAADFAKQWGLTRAEVAAIQIFTGEDYSYINPTTAADAEWLADNRVKHGLTATDAQLREEGTLHTGVAVHGLRKLPAYDEGPVYRGIALTLDKFREFRARGTCRMASASATVNEGVAQGFAYTSANKQRPEKEQEKKDKTEFAAREVAIVTEIHDAGGRDIRALSSLPKEGEVTLLPGTDFRVKSLVRIPRPDQFDPRRTRTGGTTRARSRAGTAPCWSPSAAELDDEES